MAEVFETATPVSPSHAAETWSAVSPAYQAFRVLQVGYVALPTLAGLDKFPRLLTNWDQYLAPQVARLSPVGSRGLMLIVGIVEIAAGLLVALRPKLGGYLVAFWLWAIIANLLLGRHFYDIALRDFGLSLGALALARLATAFDHQHFGEALRRRRPVR